MPVSQPIFLSPAQARVLGALVEKEITTPDYYPLSLNALINACNQLTNREPVTHLQAVPRQRTIPPAQKSGLGIIFSKIRTALKNTGLSEGYGL